MKKLLRISLIAAIIALPIAAAAQTTQEKTSQDTIATFKVENSDDVVLSSENDAVSINIAGYKIQLGNSKNNYDSEHQSHELLKDNRSSAKEVKRSNFCIAANPKLGLISLSSPDYSAYDADDKNFMDLRGGKSIYFGMDMVSFMTPLNNSGTMNLKGGVKLMCYNYTFSNDITLEYDNGLITPVAIDSSTKKSKLSATYSAFTASLSFEVAPKLVLETGMYVGVLTNAHTKYKSPEVKSDYLNGLNQAISGASVSLSYDGIGLYCDWNQTSLFAEGRGPETRALTFGLTFKL